MMRRNRHLDRAQFALELDRSPHPSPIERDTKGLVETLADLLLEALGAAETTVPGGVDE